MKKFYFPIAMLLLFVACTPQNYYQLVETKSNNLKVEKEIITYENEDLSISYNFWGNRGNGSFVIYNKTKNEIFVDLKRSHLILNGFAYTYYQNRVFTSPKVSFFSPASDDEISEKRTIKLPGVSPKSVPEQAVDITTFQEERIICIPPESAQAIFGFDLMKDVYRDCSLFRFPKSKEIVSSVFTLENSPIKFENYITYDYSEDFNSVKVVRNKFWATKITNYPSTDFQTEEFLNHCSDSAKIRTNVYPYKKSSSFYLEYKLEPSSLSH